MNGFDIEKMLDFVCRALGEFAELHADETFYAFSIDAHLLCLNSTESFADTLDYYQDKYEDYRAPEEINRLKYHSGDWAYQGFARLSTESGFDFNAYLAYLYREDEHGERAYPGAMEQLLARLKQRNAFALLKLTDDFTAFWVEKLPEV